MKLYFRGEEKGNLSYTIDGVRFTSTTLDALRDGITLPDDTDYTKVQVKAGSNVFSALDIIKRVELVQGGGDPEYDVEALRKSISPSLRAYPVSENPTSISDFVYTIEPNDFDFSHTSTSFHGSGHIGLLFRNKNTKELEWQLNGAVDNASDYEYVLILSETYVYDWCYISDPNHYDNNIYILANLGPIEPFYI